MKKIGILTFHKSINYGSVLQAWALQNVLTSKGYDVEIIDYEPKKYKELYKVLVKWNSVRNIKTNIKRILFFDKFKRQINLFGQFREKNLNISKDKYTYFENCSDIGKKYDIVICGSDQIWNLRAPDCDPIYFLPMDKVCKKIAYSVSINNTDFTEERYKDNVKKWILDFDYISDREKTGAKKISEFLNNEKEVHVTLDPTLLNSKETFEEICSPKLISEKYVFMYFASYSKSIMDAIKIIKEKTKMPVYTALTTKDGKEIINMYKDGVKIDLKNTAPGDFLSMIKYAELVVTTSFHGTAFSLIFEKNFVSINEDYGFGREKNDERIINILNYLGIDNRYILPKNIETFDFDSILNYEVITHARMHLAQKSIEWLINGIEDNNED